MIRRILIGTLVLVVAGVALWWFAGRDGHAVIAPPDAVAAMPPIPDDAFEMTVESVHDGDTLRARVTFPNEVIDDLDSTRVRLLGIDTPEISPDLDCWATEATEKLTALAPPGSTIWATADVEVHDRYDRTLLYVWTPDGRFVNGELVAAGDARVEIYSPNRAQEALLRSLEAAAVGASAGQWGACG